MRQSISLVHLVVILLATGGLISCATTAPREPAQATELTGEVISEAPQSFYKSSERTPNGPYDDCDQRTLFDQNEKFGWVCTDNYVHVYPEKLAPRKNANKLKIAAFNVYHLGDDQARLKDLNAMATIMNRWDLVGATELMPLPKDYADENRKLREVMKENQQKIPVNWRVMEPGYFKLLKALQQKDKSWALIFQPMPEGEGSTGEMAGFYYRSSKVQLQMWNYCPTAGLTDKINPNVSGLNFGCLAQVSAEQSKLMSRRAFVASFKSGEFDFIALVAHSRFRPASPADQVKQQQELCKHYPANSACSISKDKIGRFYEIKAVADQFPVLEKFDRDLIFMGDFNLDFSPNNQPAWQAALSASPGYTVYQHDNTSLSLPMQKLANSYDHFILRAGSLSECDLTSIRAYDFTKIGTDDADRTFKRLGYLLKESTHARTEKEQTDFLNQQIRLEKKKNLYEARSLTEAEKAKLSADIQRSTLRLKNNKFWILREYLSDHVPIEMVCSPQKDDD